MSKKRGRPPKAETIKPEPAQEQCVKNNPYRTELMLLNPADVEMASRIERRLNEMYSQGFDYAGNIRWSEVEIVMVYFREG